MRNRRELPDRSHVWSINPVLSIGCESDRQAGPAPRIAETGRLHVGPTSHSLNGLLVRSKRLGVALGLGATRSKNLPSERRSGGHVSVIHGEGMPFPTVATNLRKLHRAATPWIQRP